MLRYKTVCREGEATLIIEKSKFIAYVKPVSTVEEAEAFITSVRVSHRDATHNVPIYVLGERFETQKYSDDGEPSGTAGVPVLQMLTKEGITNTAIVITRYFGGIKLGTGGLVRAYTGAAKEGLKAAGIAGVRDMQVMDAVIDYTFHGKASGLVSRGDFIIRDTRFTDKVTLEIVCDPEKADETKTLLNEVTAGTVVFQNEHEELVSVEEV